MTIALGFPLTVITVSSLVLGCHNLDGYDLREAIKNAYEFYSWESVKKEL